MLITSRAFVRGAAACGLTPGWTGASVTQLNDGGEDRALVNITSPAVIGTATHPLGTATAHVFDRNHSVDVALVSDAVLNNATEAAVLGGANMAVLGNEVIQFTTATLLSPGLYRLSNFLRGRLGTEHHISSHEAGERFVLLNEAVVPLVVPSTAKGQVSHLRVTTFGDAPMQGIEMSVVVNGISLTPYSPVHVRARKVMGGTIVLSWIRRVRLDGEMRDHIDIPLKEESELYEVAVYDGATKKRSWRVTSPSVTYAVAEQTADFGSAPSSLRITVVQISALAGLGMMADATVEVAG